MLCDAMPASRNAIPFWRAKRAILRGGGRLDCFMEEDGSRFGGPPIFLFFRERETERDERGRGMGNDTWMGGY